MSELEAIGDAVTGGLAARAVEPGAGEGLDGHTNETHCLNCGAALTGPFCHQCGQRSHVHRTLSAFFHDILHGVLHVEGKIWHTLPLLVWKPGELTRRYIDGQRARFLSPVALFLFCVFLTFAVTSLTGLLDKAADNIGDGAPVVQINRDNAGAKARERTEIITGRDAAPVIAASNEVPGWIRKAANKAQANPELVFYKLKTNAYKFGWALIPISVPFVWLLFPFSRRFRLYDHTVFVTYSLCFMLLLLVAATLVGLVVPSIAEFAFFIPPIHMYRQLRGTYGVGRFGALWRTLALTIFAFVAVALFLSLILGMGEIG
jgi:hypothetical protein